MSGAVLWRIARPLLPYLPLGMALVAGWQFVSAGHRQARALEAQMARMEAEHAQALEQSRANEERARFEAYFARRDAYIRQAHAAIVEEARTVERRVLDRAEQGVAKIHETGGADDAVPPDAWAEFLAAYHGLRHDAGAEPGSDASPADPGLAGFA